MKKLYSILIAVLITTAAFSQDVITLINGNDIQARILEVSPTEVRYKRFDLLEGPVFVLPISDILMITYANGTRDIFLPQQQEEAVQLTQPTRQVPEGIRPGMRFREFRHFYYHRDFTPRFDDLYNPAIAGVASFFIPGLGQMVTGEVGRGFAFLGGTTASYILISIGVGQNLSYDRWGNVHNTGRGSVLISLGLLGVITFHTMSIVDAVRVARIKNLYLRDVRDMSAAVNFRISPYIETISLANTKITPVGLSLRANF